MMSNGTIYSFAGAVLLTIIIMSIWMDIDKLRK